MADPRGFLRHGRRDRPKRPVAERSADWCEVYADGDPGEVREQAGRCMDCGVPFCHSGSVGCPLGNLIPEWNDLVRVGDWAQAAERLHATNNFPEVTGRLCPAPCESACVLAVSPASGGAVTIKRVEQAIADQAWATGGVRPRRSRISTGTRVGVVGSGPSGLAAAQQLTRAGHEVTVFERDDRLGGLLRYGIPGFKMEKSVLDQRLAQMRAEGTRFVVNREVGGTGPNGLDVSRFRERFDAVILAVGALAGRDTPDTPGRGLAGVHLAMEHLVAANRECAGDGPASITAAGRHVVIIGGGDTGADCHGTAIRQGAASVTQLDQYPMPPVVRDDERSPWPTWPHLLRTYPAHEEGGGREFAVAVTGFVDNGSGAVGAVRLRDVEVRHTATGREVIPVSPDSREIPCDLALLAIGFEGVEPMPLLDGLNLRRSPRGTLACGSNWETGAEGVFVCGDAHRGASLVVWAIAEGRSAAAAVDAHLTGSSELPSPVHPTALPLTPA